MTALAIAAGSSLPTPTYPIGDIVVANRTRRDLGDIAALAADIAEIGLLQPVVITPNGTLIAGERRIEACKSLGWESIPVRVVDIGLIARGEYAENAFRKDFTPSEMVAIAAKLEPVERAAAKERQGTRNDLAGEFPESAEPIVAGRALDKVARVVGKDRRTLEKAKAVVAAADAEPEKYGKLVEDMDRTGRVDGPHKRLKVMKQAEAIRAEPPPYPNKGPYRVIVADPPWPYEKRQEDPSHRGVLPYTSMSIAAICDEAAQVQAIAHDDCVLWLWTTNHHMREAFEVLDAWGFEQKTILTWVKDKMGMGDWLRGQTEHCLLAVRGRPTVVLTNQTTALHAPMRANSQKPDEFYGFVETLCPAPRYAYLFSRNRRDRWDCHGDEVPEEVAE